MSSSTNLSRRLRVLEAMEPESDCGMPFLWPMGQTLDDALGFAGLTLDKPVLAIRLLGANGSCPVHDRDLHRVN